VHAPRRILIFGGTFDPPHRAHIELPPKVARATDCDRIIYVPARINPLKSDRPSPGHHRVAMLEAALAGQPNVEISTLELDREGPSYFVNTLEALREQLPGAGAEAGAGVELRFLIGCDQAIEFHRWRDWERILELAEPIVLLRPPWTRASLRAALAETQGESRAQWWVDHLANESLPRIDVSATMIRERLAQGESIDDLVTPAVGAYIREHGLYS
jgi:nicotinate-nucleotide adenylyltransferase